MSRYIDADSITEELRAWQEAMKKRGNETMAEDYEHCIDLIHQEPTADVRENVHAKKVIGGGERDGATCWFECSHCHGTVDLQDMFCKHCGAVLELENDL